MSFPPRFLDEVRDRISLATHIGKRVKLTKKGNEYSGLCPFHNEKTPSFTVSETKGFYHCFGCGAHGDVITFEMHTANVSFPEAVERLAQDAGLEIPQATPKDAEKAKMRTSLFDVLEMACQFFQKYLHRPEGQPALDYLQQQRGLTAETIAKFRLGYAPKGQTLYKFLRRENVSETLILQAGLAMRPEDGREPFDYFRDRVMFPIADRRGRVIAFGARIMGDGKPKYLNSPETEMFHKGSVLFGVALARTAAAQMGGIIATEGYMDVIALAQAGFPHAVAPLGTALTEQQLAELWKLSDAPILCMDGDSSGQRAMERAMERAFPVLQPGKTLRFATLPEGQDPDDVLKKSGAAGMQAVLDAAVPLADKMFAVYQGRFALQTPEGRAAFEQSLADVVAGIQDERVRRYYNQWVRDQLFQLFRSKTQSPKNNSGVWRGAGGMPPKSRRFAQGRAAPAGRFVAMEPPANRRAFLGNKQQMQERILLATLLNHPYLYEKVGESIGMMACEDAKLDKLRQQTVIILAQNSGLDRDGLHAYLCAQGFSDVLAALLQPAVYMHGPCAKPSTPADIAEEAWMQMFDAYQQNALADDVARARQRARENLTDGTVRTLMALARHNGTVFQEETAALPDIPADDAQMGDYGGGQVDHTQSSASARQAGGNAAPDSDPFGSAEDQDWV
jgi:DNA primase